MSKRDGQEFGVVDRRAWERRGGWGGSRRRKEGREKREGTVGVERERGGEPNRVGAVRLPILRKAAREGWEEVELSLWRTSWAGTNVIVRMPV